MDYNLSKKVIYIQNKINKIIESIYNYDVSLDEFNKYYNPYDFIKINSNKEYVLEQRYFHTVRNFDNDDLNNLKLCYKIVKKDKGYYSRYTKEQALNILHKIAILDEEAPNEDLYIDIKATIEKHPNAIFFFGSYEKIPIIQKEKDIYNIDLDGLFINIDSNYKYKKQLQNKIMLGDKDI